MAKTATGLVEYAKAQLGRPYWYGTFGQKASKELHDQKKKQYPNYYTTPYNGTTAKVHDCVGLIKGYLWCDSPEDNTPVYDPAQDKSANGMRTACKTKGEMATMPDVPGLLVFYDGHVGVYIGSGDVIEARGRKYGVVKTTLSARPWTNWGYCPYVKYETPSPKMVSIELPVLKKGSDGEEVKTVQRLLIAMGHKMISASGKEYSDDGSFGGATELAVKAFQEDNGLSVDGSVGKATWNKILRME